MIVGEIGIDIYKGEPEKGALLFHKDFRNTLTAEGYILLLNAWSTTTTMQPYDLMVESHQGGNSTMSTTGQSIANNQVRFEATWGASGSIVNINQFLLYSSYNMSRYHYQSVSQFTKEDGQSLVVRWTITFS